MVLPPHCIYNTKRNLVFAVGFLSYRQEVVSWLCEEIWNNLLLQMIFSSCQVCSEYSSDVPEKKFLSNEGI